MTSEVCYSCVSDPSGTVLKVRIADFCILTLLSLAATCIHKGPTKWTYSVLRFLTNIRD